jgi:TonB family protein
MPGNRDYFGGITDARDRRRHSRQITSLNYIKLGETNGGILLDVSEDGLACTAAEPLVGEFIPRLRFQLAENAEWIEASGRIIWLNDSKKGAGIQFVSISDEDREQIRRWVSSKTPSEIQDSARAGRRSRKESEVMPFPAPRSDTRKIETQYEILEPDLQRMFPSESVLGPEAAQPNPVRVPQVDASSAIHAAPHEEYFPSESAMRREPAVTAAPEVEIQPDAREAQHEELPSENVPQVRTTVPRFASTLQVETPPETHQAQQKESVAPERSRPIGQPEAGTEPEPASAGKTDEFRPSDFARRAARVPTFGYQTSAGYQKQEDWTNWVDPATAHRSKLGFVVLGLLLVVAAFAIGMSFGHGSFDEFAENIRRLMPDKYQPAPSVATPSAESAATPRSTAAETKTDAKADAPAQAQSAEPSAQTSETPTASNPDTPASKNEKTQAAETPSEAGTSSGDEKGKSGVSRDDSVPVLVTAAGAGEPFRLTTPETAVSASPSVAISSQTSVLVPREAGAVASQQPKRLQPGTLVFHVDPQYPRKLARNEVAIVKLLATVGENGQVINVQRISGSQPFASAAISAVREWRYSPTLFDGHPVKTEQTITIAFRSR